MPAFNGHKNWNYWNVSLWINNDEGLYREAGHCIRHSATRREAAEGFRTYLAVNGIDKTPDGAPYSLGAIRAAMVGMVR